MGDSSEARTRPYVSWESPGTAWSRTTVSSTSTATFGTRAAPLHIVTSANVDYAVDLLNGVAVDLEATMTNPSAAANVRSFKAPLSGSGVMSCVVTNIGALAYVSPSGGYLSTDVGQTWSQVAVAGAPSAYGQALGGGQYSLGSPLFRY